MKQGRAERAAIDAAIEAAVPVDFRQIGGRLWNPFSRNLISVEGLQPPLTAVEWDSFHLVLDHVTAAVESGELCRQIWPEQLFATRAVYEKFLEVLAGYDETFRITDRWWCALAELAGHADDEEGFIHTEDMAAVIKEVFEELDAELTQWTGT
jgi:hypothetical protein